MTPIHLPFSKAMHDPPRFSLPCQVYCSIRARIPRQSSLTNPQTIPFITAMFISTLVTLATFLPLLFRFGLTSPVPQSDSNIPAEHYPDPAPCSGNISWIHDPSIIYEDRTYWRFSTSGNIAVATAPSIQGPWTYQGAVLNEGTKIYIAPNQDTWVSQPHPPSFPKPLTSSGPLSIQI